MTDTTTPPGVQTTLGAAGACPEIELDGTVWKVGHPTQRAKAVLEELAASQAVREATALKGVLAPDAYRELFAEVTSQITAKAFRTWGPGWQRVVFDPLNGHLFLLSLLREHHPRATEDDARNLIANRPEEVAAALARVAPPFVRVLLSGLSLPPGEADRLAADLGSKMAPPPPTPPTA